MKTWHFVALAVTAGAAITYFTGPRIKVPTYPTDLPNMPDDPGFLRNYVLERETYAPIRPDNHARIVFADSVARKTEYAFVYLHGFGGSYRDGYPVNVNVPRYFGANVYLARWAGHGLRAEAAMEDFTPERAWEDAREALAFGLKLGEKVIIVSTSTGGTLALKLAATYPDRVHALINMGPNTKDDQPLAPLLKSPWGHELAHLATAGQSRKVKHDEPMADQYFDTIIPAEALVNLEILLQTTMNAETFSSITGPVLTTYYYDNAWEEDEHVEVSTYPEIHEQFATPAEKVVLEPLSTPRSHFVGSAIKSQDWRAAQDVIIDFCTNVLDMEPLPSRVDDLSDASPLE